MSSSYSHLGCAIGGSPGFVVRSKRSSGGGTRVHLVAAMPLINRDPQLLGGFNWCSRVELVTGRRGRAGGSFISTDSHAGQLGRGLKVAQEANCFLNKRSMRMILHPMLACQRTKPLCG